MSLYFVALDGDGELVLADTYMAALMRAVEYYLHDDVSDAFPTDEVPLAEFLARLKQLTKED